MTVRMAFSASMIMLAVAGFSGSAAASPQVLGLVASIRPVPMSCDASGCRAELSSFCLEQQRPYPPPGTVYRVAPGSVIALIVTDKRGEVRRLDASLYLSFVDSRGFPSVTAALSDRAIADLDIASVAIEIRKDATLLPEVKLGDKNPQSPDELALAMGSYRQKAERYFDDSGRDADAIRLTNAMINDLPRGELGKNAADADVLAKIEAYYQRAPVDPAGVKQAEEIHQNCVAKVDVSHHIESMRRCLEGSHDILLTHTNIDFWNSLGGS